MKELNYSELVNDYYYNLNNNLRNFRGGPGFLETWVHDEDHNRSLLEILDLAHQSGIHELKIKLTNEIVNNLNLSWLKDETKKLGSVEIQDGSELFFKNSKPSANTSDLDPLYTNAFVRASSAISYEGSLSTSVAQPTYKAEEKGSLSCAVDPQGLIVQARHQGFSGVDRVIMDQICKLMEGRPLQEMAEHGALRLESQMRDLQKKANVPGIITLENCDPHFQLPNRLLRQLFASFMKQTGKPWERNYWRDKTPNEWLLLSPEEKLVAARNFLTATCEELGLQTNVEVVEIKNDTRLVLHYTQQTDKPNFGNAMIRLERRLRDKMHFEVELQLEAIEDRNKRVERTQR